LAEVPTVSTKVLAERVG